MGCIVCIGWRLRVLYKAVMLNQYEIFDVFTILDRSQMLVNGIQYLVA